MSNINRLETAIEALARAYQSCALNDPARKIEDEIMEVCAAAVAIGLGTRPMALRSCCRMCNSSDPKAGG